MIGCCKHIQHIERAYWGKGEGVVQAEEDIKHLTKIDDFARWKFLLHNNCINTHTIS